MLTSRIIPALLFIVMIISLYLIRYHMVRYSFQEGQRIQISGTLLEDPTVKDGRQKLNLGQISAYVDQYPEYNYADKVVVKGEVAKGKAGWYLKDPQVVKVEQVGQVSQVFLNFRKNILETYKQNLPEPQSGLLSGIILGTKNSLDLDFLDQLRKTGTLHIIVASGGNIAIFAGTLLNYLAYVLKRKWAVLGVIGVIWAYVFIVGWQPPIVRAAIMGSIAFSAQALGKESFAWRALFISAVTLLLLNPLWLFDVGFQLSFAATGGILLFNKRIREKLENIRAPRIFKESLSTSLAAEIAVAPILYLTFNQSLKTYLISPVVNTLVLWCIPWIMAGGVLVGGLGLIWQGGAQIASWVVWLPLTYFVKVVEIFAKLV